MSAPTHPKWGHLGSLFKDGLSIFGLRLHSVRPLIYIKQIPCIIRVRNCGLKGNEASAENDPFGWSHQPHLDCSACTQISKADGRYLYSTIGVFNFSSDSSISAWVNS